MEINSLEELIEIKKCINTMIKDRIYYSTIETSKGRLTDNKKYLDLDYKLLDKVVKEIDMRKEVYKQLCIK